MYETKNSIFLKDNLYAQTYRLLAAAKTQVSPMKHRDRIPVTVVMRTKVVKKRHLPKRVMPFRVLTVQVVILPAEQAEMYI